MEPPLAALRSFGKAVDLVVVVVVDMDIDGDGNVNLVAGPSC